MVQLNKLVPLLKKRKTIGRGGSRGELPEKAIKVKKHARAAM